MTILTENKYLIQKYENEKLQPRELQNKIKDLELKNEKISIQNLEIEQLKKKQNQLISLNDNLKKSIKEQEGLNEELKKRITEFNNIKGVIGKFGTYKSLSKDIEILEFIMKNPIEKIRQKTLIQHFNKWSDKTVIRHLKKLVKNNLFIESDEFKGTYYLNPECIKDTKFDMELIARYILGDKIFELSISNYIEKEKNQESEDNDYDPNINQQGKKRRYNQKKRYH